MRHLLAVILLLTPVLAFPQTAVIEAFGDSLTAGLLNYTNVTRQNELTTVSEILSDLAMFKLTKDRDYLKKHEHGAIAWPQLLANHLKTPEVSFEVRNYGMSGAKSEVLYDEVTHATPVSTDTQTIAFFFIGHNDLCHNQGSEEELSADYGENVNRALEVWDRTHKGAKAFLVSVAEVHRIYPLLDGQVWFSGEKGRYRCNESWDKLFPYCPAFYKKFKQGKLDEHLAPRVDAVNRKLEELSLEWRNRSTRNQYFHIQMAPGADFRKQFFAVDCYHLSHDGQAFVAEQIFNAIGWQ